MFSQPLTLDWTDVPTAFQYRVYWGLTEDTPMLLGTSSTSSLVFPQNQLKAGTRIFWRVQAVNGLGASESSVFQFRTQSIAPTRVADHIVRRLQMTAAERTASDYDNNGVVNISDLVTNINRQE